MSNRSIILVSIILSAFNIFSQNQNTFRVNNSRYTLTQMSSRYWKNGYVRMIKTHNNGGNSFIELKCRIVERYYPVRVDSVTASLTFDIYDSTTNIFNYNTVNTYEKGEHDLFIKFADGKILSGRVIIEPGISQNIFKFDLKSCLDNTFDTEDKIVKQLCTVPIEHTIMGTGEKLYKGILEDLFAGTDSSSEFRKLFFAMRDAHRKTCVDINRFAYVEEESPYYCLVSGKLSHTNKVGSPKNNTSVSYTKSENSIINLFKYPAGDTGISWDMNIISVQKALGKRVKDLYMPSKYYNDRNSNAHFVLNGNVSVEINKIGNIKYNTETTIFYSGKSFKSNLIFEKENTVIYSTFTEPDRKHGFKQYLRTDHAAALYDKILEVVKSSGGKIVKWKYDSYDLIKSCIAIFGGRKYYITHLKGISDAYSYIEISMRL